MIGVTFKHAAVGTLRGFKLFLLLVDMANLEPDILFCKRAGRVGDDIFEALRSCQNWLDTLFTNTHIQTLIELLLLLVNYAQAEVDLVCLLEVGLHAHDL